MVVALINERESEGATPPEVLPLAGSGGLFSARNPTRFLTTAQGRVTTALAQLELFVSQLRDAIRVATLLPSLSSFAQAQFDPGYLPAFQ